MEAKDPGYAWAFVGLIKWVNRRMEGQEHHFIELGLKTAHAPSSDLDEDSTPATKIPDRVSGGEELVTMLAKYRRQRRVDTVLAMFKARYRPWLGNYPRRKLRTILYREFWSDIKNGDVFGVYDKLRASERFASADYAEIVRDFVDLMALVMSAE